MLASTVQFSTYDQTPPTCPRQTRTPPRGQQRYEKQDGPDMRSTVPVTRGARSLRTQQRAYDPVLRAIRFHTPPKRRRTGDRPKPAAELVSVPPSSTTPEARGHPRLDDRHVLGAALHHPQRGER
jgi:hypothetical protein